jgi:hypothetical protein
VAGGTLELGLGAQNCILNLGGADLRAGKIVFDYADTDPVATIQGMLNASYDNGLWDVGQFRDTTAATTGLTLGCLDDPSTHTVTVMATYPGDFNLDGVVDSLDKSVWFSNAFTTGATWQQGDANRDGVVDGLDRDLWSANAGLTAPTSGMSPPSSSAMSPVPEPGQLALLAAGLIGLLLYNWRRKR